MKISIVIPAYNEELNIKPAVLGVKDAMKHASVEDYEVIVMDDHSSDKTFDVVAGLGGANVKCIRLSRRSGSHSALRAGLEIAGGDAVLCISGDGQDDPSCLIEMLEKWHKGAHVVWALRKSRKDESWHVRLPAGMFYRIMLWLSSVKSNNIDLSRADFFLLDRKVVDAVNSCPERNTSLFGLIAWMGFNQDCAEYVRRSRSSGRSKWTFRARFHLAKDWIVAFSGIPLKIMSLFGFCVALIGFLYGLYVIVNSFLAKPAPGWSSLMVAIFILGGVQMIMLGMMGEYLWRNLEESRRRPLYFIEDATKNTNKDKS